MARIFLALALFAVLLLLANLVYAFAFGDFGAASQTYQDQLNALRKLEVSPDASLDAIHAQRERVQQSGRELRRQRDRFWPHVWLGIVASLVALLVNSISITYFIGTSRWCREVVEAYAMDSSLAEKSQALKRRSFPWALTGILTTLAIAALGAAADPYSSVPEPSYWVPWHYLAALFGIFVIGLSFLVQIGAVGANYETINEILAEAERIKRERGAEAGRSVPQETS